MIKVVGGLMPVLNFKGKSTVYSHHLGVPFRSLEIDEKKSLLKQSKDKTKVKSSLDDNLIIHGDNLHALKALLPRYAGKIKCIYIDPPYNTGNENWKYNDNVNSPIIQEWLEKVVGSDDLERHDKWLCMMWPRLQLLKELLSDDGVIFISIDDNEQHHLQMIMDEIFGEENFISCVTRVSKTASDKGSHFAPSCDYLLVFSKNKSLVPDFYDEVDKKLYKKTDQKGRYRDDVAFYQSALDPMRGCSNQRYYIQCPDGSLVIPPGDNFPKKKIDSEHIEPKNENDKVWRWSYETYKRKKEFLVFKKTKTSPLLNSNRNRASYNIYTKSYLSDREVTGVKPRDFLSGKEFLNRKGADYLKNLEINFSYPKPKELLIYILKIIKAEKTSIILDSFAGSGTTAHAVLDLNKEDGGNRKFILVECEDYANKITAERVRRAIKGVPKAKEEKLKKGLGGSFTYCILGKEINEENLIKGKSLPNYKVLSSYVYYVATGHTLDKINENEDFYIGKSDKDTAFFVIYKPNIKFLRSRESSLNLDRKEKIKRIMSQKKCKKAVVFAPVHYFDSANELAKEGIIFCQLPFSIYKIAGV